MTVAYIPLARLFEIAQARGFRVDVVVVNSVPFVRLCAPEVVEVPGEEVPEQEARAA